MVLGIPDLFHHAGEILLHGHVIVVEELAIPILHTGMKVQEPVC